MDAYAFGLIAAVLVVCAVSFIHMTIVYRRAKRDAANDRRLLEHLRERQKG